jgi:aspartate/methionine/tyrosine aminotransferase
MGTWVAPRVRQLPRVGSRVVDEEAARLRAQGRDVLDLHAHPARPLPPHVLEAATAAAASPGVAPSRGLSGLRDVLATLLSDELGGAIDPEREVLVTAGAMQGLDLVLGAVLEPGDEVLTVAPGFFLDGLLDPRRARLVTVRSRPEDGYAVDWEAVERAVTPSTRVLLLVTPGNPTGYVLTPDDVEAVARLAERRDLLVLSDESYDRFVYDGRRHLSPCGHPDLRARSALIRSFTKSYAMAAWRVGYLVGPPALIDGCLNLLEWSTLYGSLVPQAAAEAVLTGPRGWLEGIRQEFQGRRDRVYRVLRELGVPTVLPHGAPFLFPSVDGFGTDDEVARRLLREHGVPVVRGRLLGGPGHVRLPIGGDDSTLDQLGERLARMFIAREAAPAVARA